MVTPYVLDKFDKKNCAYKHRNKGGRGNDELKHKDTTKVRYASLASPGVAAFATVGFALVLGFTAALALLFALALAEIRPTKVSIEGAGRPIGC